MRSSWGSARRASMTRRSMAVVRSWRSMSDAGSRGHSFAASCAEVERLLAGEAEARRDRRQRDAGAELRVQLRVPSGLERGHRVVDDRRDPLVDPPLRPFRRERRLHQRPVAAVLVSDHLQDAPAEHHGREPGVERRRRTRRCPAGRCRWPRTTAPSRPAPPAGGSAHPDRSRGAHAPSPCAPVTRRGAPRELGRDPRRGRRRRRP